MLVSQSAAAARRRARAPCVGAVGVRGEHAEASLEDAGGRAEARPGERGGVEAGAAAQPGMEALRPRAVGEELHRARRPGCRRCRARRERARRRARGRRPRPPRRRRRRTCPSDGSRGDSARPGRAPGEAAGHLVARDRGAQHGGAARAAELGRGERRREDGRAEVDGSAPGCVSSISSACAAAPLASAAPARPRGARRCPSTVAWPPASSVREATPQDDARLDVRAADRDAQVVAEEVHGARRDVGAERPSRSAPHSLASPMRERRAGAHRRSRAPSVRARTRRRRRASPRLPDRPDGVPAGRPAAMRARHLRAERALRLGERDRLARRQLGGERAGAAQSSAAGTTSSASRRRGPRRAGTCGRDRRTSRRSGPSQAWRTISRMLAGKGTPTWISVRPMRPGRRRRDGSPRTPRAPRRPPPRAR